MKRLKRPKDQGTKGLRDQKLEIELGSCAALFAAVRNVYQLKKKADFGQGKGS
jgi:hypothetical protein